MKKSKHLAVACVLFFGTGSLFAQKGDAVKGKAVFEQCAGCHNADSADAKIGPGLKGLYKKKSLNGGKAVNDANVLQKLNEGGNGMPGYKDSLSDAEKANVIAYLKTL